MIGSGGIFTESLRDVAMLPLWACPDLLEDALDSTRLGAALRSQRAGYSASRRQLLRAAASLARWAEANAEVLSVDIDPLILSESEAIGVDALVELSSVEN